MSNDSPQELNVGVQANYLVLLKSKVSFFHGGLPVFSVTNQFRNHWVVKRRDTVTLSDACVDSD